jgi:hypothetical protein
MSMLLLMWWCLGAIAAPQRAADADWVEAPRSSGSVFAGTLAVTARVWRAISIGDGNRCSFSPTCSSYAWRAVRRDGVLGVVLAFDRLQRDGIADEYPLAPDKVHRLDPVERHAPAVDLLVTGRTCRQQRRAGAVACL